MLTNKKKLDLLNTSIYTIKSRRSNYLEAKLLIKEVKLNENLTCWCLLLLCCAKD